jgi:bacterioferritin-associated ferredoxin
MIQNVIILALFALALIYVGRMLIKSFTKSTGCASGCGKCGVDFTKIERQLEKKS